MLSCSCFGVGGGSDALSARFAGLATATPISPTSVALTWTPQSDYTKYTIYSSAQQTPIVSLPTGNTYTVNGLKPNTTYSFSVIGTAANGNQYGGAKQVKAMTWANFLGPAAAAPVDGHSIAVTWNYNPGPNFLVYYALNATPTISSGAPPVLLRPALTTSASTGVTVSGLLPNATYSFMVVAKYADGTDSLHTALGNSSAATAQFVNTGGLRLVPTITTSSTQTTSIPPVFNVTGGASTYQHSFALFTPPSTSVPLGTLVGNGALTATSSLPAGTQTVTVTSVDLFTGLTASSVFSGINVVAALPNNGLKVVSAKTTSLISPLPTIATSAISLGPYPTFTVTGAQPGYVTTIYNPLTNPPTPLGTVVGNGQFVTLTSSPLPQGNNTLFAIVSYNGDSARIDNILVKVKSFDAAPVQPPTGINAGIGQSGFGRSMAVGDFNCDGRPDLAVGAPQGNGVFVYYGTASGLDYSAAPSTTPTGTKPLYIPSPASINYSDYTAPGTSQGYANGGATQPNFGAVVKSGNFNGDSANGKPCMDLVVSADQSWTGASWNVGVFTIYYGSPQGLQVSATPQLNAFTCAGLGSNSCDSAYYQYWTAGVPPPGPITYSTIYYYYPGAAYSLAVGDIDGDGFDDLVSTAPMGDWMLNLGYSGFMMLHRGTANGLSPLYTPITFPTILTQTAGPTSAHAMFGMQATMGHFITSPRSSGGPMDLAVSFQRLSPDAAGLGITDPTFQSGLMVIPGSAAAPYLGINGSGVVNNYYLIMPKYCNSNAVIPGWTLTGAAGWCAQNPNTLIAADVNQDDYDDLIFSNQFAQTNTASWGAIFVYFGGSNIGQFTTQGSQATMPSPSNVCNGQPCSAGQMFTMAGSTAFGSALASLGDTNNDGYPDIGIGAEQTAVLGRGWAGSTYILHGALGGLTTSGATTINPSKNTYAFFGSAVAGAKFSDPNGFANLNSLPPGVHTTNDLVVGALGDSPANRVNGVAAATGSGAAGSQGQGTASLFVNSVSGFPSLLTAATATLAPDNIKTGHLESDKATLAGDLNGDGYADVVMRVVHPNYNAFWGNNNPQPMSAYGFVVYYGSPTGFITSRLVNGVMTPIQPSYTPVNLGDPLFVTASTLSTPSTPFGYSTFARVLTPAGDVNGDTFSDLMVSDHYNNIGVMFYGSPSGLIVSPTPAMIPYDAAHRPNLNPTIIATNYYTLPWEERTLVAGSWGNNTTFGDFNGDKYGDVAFFNPSSDYVVILYGSKWGLITDGNVYDPTYGTGGVYPGAPATNKVQNIATCAAGPIACTPEFIPYGATTLGWTVFNAGDMDGDGTDDLVSINPYDTWGGQGAGVIRIYYGSVSNGIDPNVYVDLHIDMRPAMTNRFIGAPNINVTAYYDGSAGTGFDINGDNLADIVAESWNEGTGYVIYGVPGPGSSPTHNSGPYILQGLCAGNVYPCTVAITNVAAPDFNPNHVVDINTSQPSSCSPALRSCNVMRFDEPDRFYGYDTAGIFGVGDITGDIYGEVVVSRAGGYAGVYNSGGANYGAFYVYSGSANGLQVAGTPSNRPTCVNGICTPYRFTMPATLNVTPQVYGYGWYSVPWQHPMDVDGDGKRDFLISNKGLNVTDSNNNIVSPAIGGFFLFH